MGLLETGPLGAGDLPGPSAQPPPVQPEVIGQPFQTLERLESVTADSGTQKMRTGRSGWPLSLLDRPRLAPA